MPFDPSSAQLVTAFDPTSAQLVESDIAAPTPQREQDWIDNINSFGGGVATGLVDAAGKVGGLVTDPLPNNIKQPIREFGNTVATALKPGSDSIPGQAMQDNPNFATAGKIVGETAPYAIPGMAAGRYSNMALGGLAGASNTDDGLMNRVTGAAFGAATTGLLDAAFEGLKIGVQALRSSGAVKKLTNYVGQKIDDLNTALKGSPREVGTKAAANIYTVTKQADNELFETFRNAKGNIAPEIRTIKRSIEDLGDEFVDTMTNQQKQVVAQALKDLDNATSLSDLHNARLTLQSGFKNFSPSEGAIISKRFGNVKQSVDDIMESAATKLGVGKEYLAANEHYRTKLLPLLNNDFDDVAAALKYAEKDPVYAGKVLDKFIDKHIRPDSPQATKAFLNLFDDTGRQAVEMRQLERMLKAVEESNTPALTFQKQLDKLGKTGDVLFSGENKQLVNATKNILNDARPLLRQTLQNGQITNLPFQAGIGLINKLMSTAPGRVTLKLLGEPSVPKKYLGEMLKIEAAQVAGDVGSDVVNAMRYVSDITQPDQQDTTLPSNQVVGIRN